MIIANVFVAPLLPFADVPFAELIKVEPFSFGVEVEVGRSDAEMVDCTDVVVEVRMVDRDEEKLVVINP